MIIAQLRDRLIRSTRLPSAHCAISALSGLTVAKIRTHYVEHSLAGGASRIPAAHMALYWTDHDPLAVLMPREIETRSSGTGLDPCVLCDARDCALQDSARVVAECVRGHPSDRRTQAHAALILALALAGVRATQIRLPRFYGHTRPHLRCTWVFEHSKRCSTPSAQ